MDARDIIKESIDVGMEIGRLKCRAETAETRADVLERRYMNLVELVCDIRSYCADETLGDDDAVINTISSMIEHHKKKHGAL